MRVRRDARAPRRLLWRRPGGGMESPRSEPDHGRPPARRFVVSSVTPDVCMSICRDSRGARQLYEIGGVDSTLILLTLRKDKTD